jgi:hypothetical protein
LPPEFSAGLHIINIVATIAYVRFAMFGFVTNYDSRQNIAEIPRNIKLVTQLDFFLRNSSAYKKVRTGNMNIDLIKIVFNIIFKHPVALLHLIHNCEKIERTNKLF